MTTDPSTPHELGRRRRGGDFRPDIEGLRAVAILAVVAYHAGLSVIPGGYVGVDVFFVISGFLITDHLSSRARREGRRRLRGFYARRARRLLPSALLVIGVTVAVSCVVLPPLQAMAVAKDGLANAFYVGNYRYALQATNYLSASGPVSPLLNYWSLGVEEQFYLVWPALLWAASLVWWRRPTRTGRAPHRQDPAPVLDRLRGDGAPGSLLPGLFDLVDSGQRAMGLLLAPDPGLGTGRRGPPGPRRPTAWPTASRWGIPAHLGRDRGHRLFGRHLHVGHPVPGHGGPRPGGRRRRGGRRRLRPPRLGAIWLLRRRPLQIIGRVSYTWYLWHWPALVLAPWIVGHRLSVWGNVAVCGLALVLAGATTVLLERPLQRASWLVRPRRSLLLTVGLSGAVIATILLSTAALPSLAGSGHAPPPSSRSQRRESGAGAGESTINSAAFAAQSLTDSIQSDVAQSVGTQDVPANLTPSLADAASDEAAPFVDGCFDGFTENSVNPCNYGDVTAPPSKTVVLFGDSHALMWFPAFENLANQYGWHLIPQAKATCPPINITVYSPESRRVVHRVQPVASRRGGPDPGAAPGPRRPRILS